MSDSLILCCSDVSKQAEKRASGSVSLGVVDLWGYSDFVLHSLRDRPLPSQSIAILAV
jgi:hypothetical protein